MKKYPLAHVLRTGGYVKCGPNTMMRVGGVIHSTEIGTVTIGDWCAIGKNVYILGATHDPIRPVGLLRRIREAPVKIGNHVWIGNNVVIAPGVTIGDNSVIGANVVVRKDVPSGGYVRVICETLTR